MPRYLIKIILLLSLWESACAQRLSWRNYSVDQGLPGNVVYDMMEDSRGYLWFVTDQGICRFNGYEFIQPVDTSAMRGGEAFVPTEDAEGNIWFTRLDASVWFIENDTVRAWKYNPIVAAYRDSFREVEQIAIAENGAVWVALSVLGFLIVKKDGNYQVVRGSNQDCFLYSEVAKKLVYITRYSKKASGKAGLPSSLPLEVVLGKTKKPSTRAR